jgi:hypothetical protein
VTQIWRIELLVETDDEAEVEELVDAVAKVACPVDPADDHVCRVPWFVVRSPLATKKARAWRDVPNR